MQTELDQLKEIAERLSDYDAQMIAMSDCNKSRAVHGSIYSVYAQQHYEKATQSLYKAIELVREYYTTIKER